MIWRTYQFTGYIIIGFCSCIAYDSRRLYNFWVSCTVQCYKFIFP